MSYISGKHLFKRTDDISSMFILAAQWLRAKQLWTFMTLNNDERDSMTEERPFKSKKEKQSDKSVSVQAKKIFLCPSNKGKNSCEIAGGDIAIWRFELPFARISNKSETLATLIWKPISSSENIFPLIFAKVCMHNFQKQRANVCLHWKHHLCNFAMCVFMQKNKIRLTGGGT